MLIVVDCLHSADVSRSRTTEVEGSYHYPSLQKGSAGTVANYRPKSLTCVPSKIMERLISSRMLRFLDNNILHDSAQHGFLNGRSTCTNLMECMNDWTLSVQYKRLVTVIYIDVSERLTLCPTTNFSFD